jgi:hypothetical protein
VGMGPVNRLSRNVISRRSANTTFTIESDVSNPVGIVEVRKLLPKFNVRTRRRPSIGGIGPVKALPSNVNSTLHGRRNEHYSEKDCQLMCWRYCVRDNITHQYAPNSTNPLAAAHQNCSRPDIVPTAELIGLIQKAATQTDCSPPTSNSLIQT